MTHIMVALPELKEYKQVVVLDRPGVVYVNMAADPAAKMALILPSVERMKESM